MFFFVCFQVRPPLKIVIESSEKLTEGDLEEIVDLWNRKGSWIAVIQIIISLHMHTLTYQHQ